MSRKIPNRPHPTPNPDKPHSGAGPDRGNHARAVSGLHAAPGQASSPGEEPATDEPNYDSCFDDLNVVLSQSMQEPDPDPNLESSGVNFPPGDSTVQAADGQPAPRGEAPRTSEIFRTVVAPAAGSGESSRPVERLRPEGLSAVDEAIPDLGVLDRPQEARDAPDEKESHTEGRVPWGQVLLLSYSSALTLALIWMFWTGRIPKPGGAASSAVDSPAAESPLQPTDAAAEPSPPPLPPENLTLIDRIVRLGDLEVTPRAIEGAHRGAVPCDRSRQAAPRGRLPGPPPPVRQSLEGPDVRPGRSEPRQGARDSGRSIPTSRRPTGRGAGCFPWRWTANGRSPARNSPSSGQVSRGRLSWQPSRVRQTT